MTVGLMLVVRNEVKRIKKCLDWHLPYVDEVAICDQQSNDGTWEFLQSVAKDSKIPFKIWQDKQWGYCEPSKQKTADLLKTDWILYIDPDEQFPKEFLDNMQTIIKHKEFDGFTFPRNNIFQVQVYDNTVPIKPKWLSVQHPSRDYQLRLTRRKLSVFPIYLHNRVRVDGQTNGVRIGRVAYAIDHVKTITEQWDDQKRYKIIK